MRKYRKNIIAAVCGILVIAVLVTLAYTTEHRSQKKYKIIFIPKTIDENNDFWTSLIDGAVMGASEYGASIEVVAAEKEDNYKEQIAWINWAIKQKPDAILVAPSTYSDVTDALEAVKENGIKLILVDSVVDKDISNAIVATDNVAAGEVLGGYAKSLIGDEDQIGIVGHVKGTSTAIERERGVRKGLGKKKDNIQEVVFCDSSYDKAYTLTVEMLKKYPDLSMVIGLNEYSAVGAARAIRDLGYAGDVKIVGFDSSIEEIQLMEEGVFQGIVIQKPFNMGYQSVEQAVQLLKGKTIKKNTDSGRKLITMENLNKEENQKLLFPFNEK